MKEGCIEGARHCGGFCGIPEGQREIEGERGVLREADKGFVLEIKNCRDYNYHTQQKDGICAARDHDSAVRQDLP